jgi:hypothetical protein
VLGAFIEDIENQGHHPLLNSCAPHNSMGGQCLSRDMNGAAWCGSIWQPDKRYLVGGIVSNCEEFHFHFICCLSCQCIIVQQALAKLNG